MPAELTDVEYDEDEGVLTAQALLPNGREVSAQLEPDDESDDDAEVLTESESLAVMQRALDRLTEPAMVAIELEIVTELTDAAYEDDDEEPTPSDYDALARDLELTEVTVFADATVLLHYESQGQYPDATITAQLDEELGLDDLVVETDD